MCIFAPQKIRMKRILIILCLMVMGSSCKKEPQGNMLVTGEVKGLKKGVLYLQQFQDSTLVVLDSLEIKGDGKFSFSHWVESPEIFYLFLDKKDNNQVNDRITFFGEEGTITINTAWNTFDTQAKISGSKANEKLQEFQDMVSQFNIRELVLVQQAGLPQIQADPKALDSLQGLIDQNTINRYRYALNFGFNNGSSYATPYIMLTAAAEANPKYLDSVYRSLSPEVAASKYGKAFREYLDQRED